MRGLAGASSGSKGGPLPSIFLDQTEDNSAKKIIFWIKLLHTLRSGGENAPSPPHPSYMKVPICHCRLLYQSIYRDTTLIQYAGPFSFLKTWAYSCLPALVIVITKLQEVWPEVNYVFFTIVNAWNQLTHKITRWLTDLNCICTLFVNVTIMFILGSSVIIIQMAKTSIFWPFLFWSIHLILSYPNRYFAMNKLYTAVAVVVL